MQFIKSSTLQCPFWAEINYTVKHRDPFDAWFDLGEGQGIKVRATLSEARTMEYLRKHSSIPIPRVIMAFERAEEAFIVTERVEGDTLRNLCMADVLDEGQTISIAKQLAGYLTELHTLDSIPVSERTLGSWPNGPFRNLFFYCSWSSAPVPLPSVAYRTTQEFHQYWLSRLRLTPKALNALQNAIDTAPPPGHPILSHGDLNARNILVKDARIVGIIDWETFGWWPDFWETMSMRRGGRNSPKWRTAIPAVFGSQTEMESTYSSALDALTMLDMFQ
ncbi:kinase-like domain-containing protein [Mucidula mucida]|nr:kinase-like domain-containing protein [Mucidula mucida]